jgi:hypothetical protein
MSNICASYTHRVLYTSEKCTAKTLVFLKPILWIICALQTTHLQAKKWTYALLSEVMPSLALSYFEGVD